MTEEDLKNDHAELTEVWRWYKQHAHRTKTDPDWSAIATEATTLVDKLHTVLGKNIARTALQTLYEEGRSK